MVRFGDELADFARLGVAPQPGFLEYGRTVQQDFEPASTRRDQIDGRRWITLPQLSRQTGGSGLVVSNRAVFDLNVHRNHSGAGSITRPADRYPLQSMHRACDLTVPSETLR